MRYVLLIFIVGFMSVEIQAQNAKSTPFTITESWVVDPANFKEDFDAQIRHVAAPFPSGASEKSFLEEQKRKSAELYPRRSAQGATRSTRGVEDTVTVLDSFAVRFFINDNIMVGGTPNDNTLAISNDGMLLASYNSQVWGYDINADTFLFRPTNPHPSFVAFTNNYGEPNLSAGSNPFDPKLYYDPGRDRFVFLFLSDGRDTTNSGTVIGFSSTNYPSDPWYLYRLSGNPFEDGTWTDYPQIALNDHSLYLTLNQLNGPDWVTNFDYTLVWQLDLDDAFAGEENLESVIHTGFEYEGKSLKYMRPVKTAFGAQGDDMYFVTNRPRAIANDSIWLHRITGAVGETNDISTELIISDVDYGIPPYAQQANGNTFWTNDARPLGAIRVQDEIQFVGNSINHETGLAAVFHGVIEDVNNPTLKGHIISDPEMEFGFCNIEFMGVSDHHRDMLINFNHTSPNHPAGNASVVYTNDREYGPVQLLVEGETYVDMIPNSFDENERWGDYIGLQRKYNEPLIAWTAGYVSHGNQRAGTWISKVRMPIDIDTIINQGVENYVVNGDTFSDLNGTLVPLAIESDKIDKKPIVFPNPARDMVNVEFDVSNMAEVRAEVYSINGQLVEQLINQRVRAGKNVFSFNLAPFPPGVYIIKLTSGSELIHSEKLIRN